MRTPGSGQTGIGMTSDRTRARMVERLREQGIADPVVLAAVQAVPRHLFVDEALAIRAYDDVPLPIGHGQTISQPWVVARMSELARDGRDLDSVLEIGTGCGYQAAVLSHLARQVYTVERIAALMAKAKRNLKRIKIRNVAFKHGDGSAELGEDLVVDAIIVTAGTAVVPKGLLAHLGPGGRMVLPLAKADDAERGLQRLTVIEAAGEGYRERMLDPVRFVPLLPGLA